MKIAVNHQKPSSKKVFINQILIGLIFIVTIVINEILISVTDSRADTDSFWLLSSTSVATHVRNIQMDHSVIKMKETVYSTF